MSQKKLPWYLDGAWIFPLSVLFYGFFSTLVMHEYLLPQLPDSTPTEWELVFYYMVPIIVMTLAWAICINWLIPRHQRFALRRLRQISQTLQRRSGIDMSTSDPYRSLGAFTPAELVRWRVENDPDVSDDVRRLADIEDRIATLEAALHPTPSARS